jgi:hypothetical protein
MMTVYTKQDLTKMARAAITDRNRLPKHTGKPLHYIGWTIAVGATGAYLQVQYGQGDIADYFNIPL